MLLLFATAYNSSSQENNWTTKITKDGKTTVKYNIEKVGEGTYFHYTAQGNVSATLDELDVYFSNSDNHKNFLENTPKSEEVEKISDDEWIIYYYFDAPWPMADNDVVAKIIRVKEDNKLIFTASAIANDYKKTKINRITTYQFVYEFEKVDDKTTKTTISADYIPAVSVPKFLIKTWFPEGPAKIVSKLEARE